MSKEQTITTNTETEQVQVFDSIKQTVRWVNTEDLANQPHLTLAIPPRLKMVEGKNPEAVYHPNSDINHTIKAGLRRIESLPELRSPETEGLANAVLYSSSPDQAVQVTTELLLDSAGYLEAKYGMRKDGRLPTQLLEFAVNLEQLAKPKPKVVIPDGPDWSFTPSVEHLLPSMDEATLSSGEMFKDYREQQALKEATDKVERALGKINTSFDQLVTQTQVSLGSNLLTKARALLDVEWRQEDRLQLSADSIAILANLRYCEQFLARQASYSNFEAIASDLTGDVQQEIIDADSKPKPQIADLKQALLVDLTQALPDMDPSERDRLAGILASDLGEDKINGPETKLQAISSLRGQFKDAHRVRNNAIHYIEGDPDKQGSGLKFEASHLKRRQLSQATNEQNIPVLNTLASRGVAKWLSQLMAENGLDLSSKDKIIAWYAKQAGDDLSQGPLPKEVRKLSPDLLLGVVGKVKVESLLDEIKSLDPDLDYDQLGFEEFLARTYSTSTDETRLDELKAELMRTIVPLIEETLNCDVRERFDQVMDQVTGDVSKEDLVDAVKSNEEEITFRRFGHNLNEMLTFLNVPAEERDMYVAQHSSEIMRVMLAYYEVSTKANDDHLNDREVLTAITESVFFNRPMSLQIIRCLRWCYPNRDVDIAPHMGDYPTQRANGEAIVRHGWVEEEKLRIFDRAVVSPMKHHGVPVKNVTLLATGDYELVGEGYGYTSDHPQSQKARAYVEDVRRRVPELGIFGDTPVETYSLAEKIQQFGQERFDGIIGSVRQQYDELSKSNEANFLGYTGPTLERVIDTEHQHRIPFIEWWERQNSRDFTRHIVTFGAAFSVVLAAQEGPRILTVSGNQYAARNFSFGHLLDPELKPIGITLINSVNDGDQSEHFRKMTTVVE